MKKPSTSKPRRFESKREIVARITEENRRYFARLDGKKPAAGPRRIKSQTETGAEKLDETHAGFAKNDVRQQSNKSSEEFIELVDVEIISDESPGNSFDGSKKMENNPVEAGGASNLSCLCPRCRGEITYAPECGSLVSQCPNCKSLIILGRPIPRKDLPSRDAFTPSFQEDKSRENYFSGNWSISTKLAIFMVWIGFILFAVLIYRNDPATKADRNEAAVLAQQRIESELQQNQSATPADASPASLKWAQGAFANGNTPISESEDAKWDWAKGLADQSKYGVTAQTFYDGLNKANNPSNESILNASGKLSEPSADQSKNPDGYKYPP